MNIDRSQHGIATPPRYAVRVCPTCNGRGTVPMDVSMGSRVIESDRVCAECDGKCQVTYRIES